MRRNQGYIGASGRLSNLERIMVAWDLETLLLLTEQCLQNKHCDWYNHQPLCEAESSKVYIFQMASSGLQKRDTDHHGHGRASLWEEKLF